MIRVVVVDDEALVRSGFSLILNGAEDIEVVAAVPGGQALAAFTEHSPDLVLLDVRMPDVNGLALLEQLLALPAPPVVAMLTTFDSDEYIAQALGSGASGYILKDTDPEDLPPLVRSLIGGAVVLDRRIAPVVVGGYLSRQHEPEFDSARGTALNRREREVVTLLAQGLTNAEIGRHMHLSTGTVKDHVSSLLAKLAVDNRVQAALWAQRAGLLVDNGVK
ncbi:response regulator [Kitasatospora sp. NPDC089913]|uniref:response regulator n=1 Tax=Kitasatospora sp. NPDC089913 TaxID=3364080 RepID=UPI003821BD1A